MKYYELAQCVFHFAAAMHKQLRRKELQGFQGWNNREYLDEGEIAEQLQLQIDKGNYVHAANFCMFAWNMQPMKGKDT